MANFFETLQGKKVAFIGAGVSHRELVPMFARSGARVTLCDNRPLADFGEYGEELMQLGVRLSLGESYLDGLSGQQMILRTPGFSYFTPELQAMAAAGAEVTSEMELFFRYCPCRTIGVTGSDGKTTTTSLIAAILQQTGKTVHLGGNIGRALLPIVDDIGADDIAVVELSSFQLISMQTSPDIAVVTNLAANHLDVHKDMTEYVNAKRNILLHQKKDGVAVLNGENELTRSMQSDVRGECRYFSRLNKVENGACLNSEGFLCIAKDGEEIPVVPQAEVKLRGLHNIENLLAAFAAVRDEAETGHMAQAARTFAGVEHRMEEVRVLHGVQWINDSIATSPTRVSAGLQAFGKKLIMIAGGADKNVPFDSMVNDVLGRVKILILTGPAAPKIEEAIRANIGYPASRLEIINAQNLQAAVKLANEKAQDGDIVTLSPACTSFDAYKNFEERGRHFKELVNAL